jgi:hypothetical protein
VLKLGLVASQGALSDTLAKYLHFEKMRCAALAKKAEKYG